MANKIVNIVLMIAVVVLSICMGTIIDQKNREIETLKELQQPLPLGKDDARLLEIYQECFLELSKKHPDCSKNFQKLMQNYE